MTVTSRLIVAAMLVASFAGLLFGQTAKQPEPIVDIVQLKGFRIKGGIVNFSEGDVSVKGKKREAPVWALQSGDVMRVGEGGRAEVLLNPGYYLRLGANTELAFLDLAPDNMKLKLLKGSAILEVAVNKSNVLRSYYPDNFKISVYEPVTVVTPGDEYAVVQGGVYRFDVPEEGASELKVLKGAAFTRGHKVATGERVAARNGSLSLTKIGRAAEDAFDVWSRERAALLVRSNKSLKNTDWYGLMRKNRFGYFDIKDEDAPELARSEFTVSALGGIASFAEEGVYLKRGAEEWRPLSEGDRLEYGDRVRNDRDSRAEIVLYPGCYLYLSGGTEVSYAGEPGKGLTVGLLRGSAIIISKLKTKEQGLVTVAAPGLKYEIEMEGVYRFDASHGRSEMVVYEGRARGSSGDVKEGKKAVLDGGGLNLLSVDKKGVDSFHVWSRKRAAWLTVDEGYRHLLSLIRTNRARFRGLWYFDQSLGQHVFVPGYWYFDSPYGGQYSVKFKAW